MPKSKKELPSFFMLCFFYHIFVRDFARITGPFHKLKLKDTPFEWDSGTVAAFKLLREKMCSAPILKQPDSKSEFCVYTDASYGAIGAALMHKDDDGVLKLVQYAIWGVKATGRKYSKLEREAPAVVVALNKFRHYLLSEPFTM